jgi:hypothetical protein
MRIRTLMPACLALALFASSAEAQFSAQQTVPGENFHLELAAMFWTPTPGIVLGSDGLAALGPNGVDFVQEFGIENKRFTEFRAVLKGGRNKLRFSRVPLRYEESALLRRTISFGGQTFNVAAIANANLEWETWTIGYENDFVSRSRGYLGFITELRYNKVTADLSATSLGQSVASLTEVKAPIPAFGIVARVYPHRNVSITGEITGFKVPGFLADKLFDGDEIDVNIKNVDIYATVSITRFFGIQGGYRSLKADYVVDDDTGDLEMKGPYFGGMVRF